MTSAETDGEAFGEHRMMVAETYGEDYGERFIPR